MNKIGDRYTGKKATLKMHESARITVKDAGCKIQGHVINLFANTSKKFEKRA